MQLSSDAICRRPALDAVHFQNGTVCQYHKTPDMLAGNSNEELPQIITLQTQLQYCQKAVEASKLECEVAQQKL